MSGPNLTCTELGRTDLIDELNKVSDFDLEAFSVSFSAAAWSACKPGST